LESKLSTFYNLCIQRVQGLSFTPTVTYVELQGNNGQRSAGTSMPSVRQSCRATTGMLRQETGERRLYVCVCVCT